MQDYSELQVGDRIKVTVEGTVKMMQDNDHAACTHIEDRNGFNHYVFLMSSEAEGEVIETYTAGNYYRDDDGETLLYLGDDSELPWYSFTEGCSFSSGYPRKPIRQIYLNELRENI